MYRFEVEYDFVETKYGCRPMYIKRFKKESEAKAFAETQKDAQIIELIETGKEIYGK